MTKIQPVCRLTSDLLTEHSPHPSYHAARIHTEKNDQHFSLGDYWKLFLLFHVPFYDIFDKSNCFNFEVPIDKETNNPFSGMIISSSNCSVHCVNISRYKLARINFFVPTKKLFPFSGRPQARVCEAAEASAQDGGECRQDHLGICSLCCPHYRCRQLENIPKADKKLRTPL